MTFEILKWRQSSKTSRDLGPRPENGDSDYLHDYWWMKKLSTVPHRCDRWNALSANVCTVHGRQENARHKICIEDDLNNNFWKVWKPIHIYKLCFIYYLIILFHSLIIFFVIIAIFIFKKFLTSVGRVIRITLSSVPSKVMPIVPTSFLWNII